MSKLDDAYKFYCDETVQIYNKKIEVYGMNNFFIHLDQEDLNGFTHKLLHDDDFNDYYSRGCTVNLTEEKIALNPDGPKRKLI